MATTKKVQLPEGFDPYDMRLKRQFSDQADKMNVIALSRKNYNLCCGAMHNGQPCKNPAGMGTPHKGYGRCKIHGGLATGPKTAEGRARQIAASTKHGLFSKVLLPEEESILESINQEEEFNALDMMIKVQTVKIVSYLQKHKDRFVKDRDLEGEEVAYRKSRVICREGDGMKTFYHAGTIEDNALDRAMNTLRRLIGQKHLIEGKDDGPDDIMASLNAELRAASKGEVYVSWGGQAQSNLKLEINDDTGEAAPSHGPVAASSLIQQRRLIIAALEYAVDKGRINRNPGKKTRRPKSKPKTNNILTDEDMETLGIKGTKYRYYPAYMLTLTTACRRGEILGLDWQHVDIGIPWTTVDRYFPWGDIKKLPKWDTKALKTLLEDHNITLGDGYLRLVYQMVDDNGTPFRDELKTDLSRRSLMITEEMVLLLIFWRLIQNIEKKKAAEREIEYNPDNLVFCTRKGTYIYPRNFTKMWSENLRSMGIDHKRFHDLRHTVATVMLEDGEAMNTVQEQLGHYDAGFTASRYGHVTAKMRNSAAVKLGERLEKVRNPEAEDANSVKNEDTIIPFQEGRKLKSAACKIK